MNPFDAAYQHGTPPWDLGRPQAAFLTLADQGAFSGRVLDVGCGTGDLAIELAERGCDVWGIDASPLALRIAAQRAQARGQLGLLDADPPRADGSARGPTPALRLFNVDALDLGKLRTSFDIIIDCGFFHALSDKGRERYLASLAAVSRSGTRLHLLCFSNREPEWGGPRRISQAELEHTFSGGWSIDELVRARFEHRGDDAGAEGWLMSATFFGVALKGMQ